MNRFYGFGRGGSVVLAAVVLACLGQAGLAEPLNLAKVKFSGENARDLPGVRDGKYSTAWSSKVSQKAGVGFTLDFRRPQWFHRLYLHSGTNSFNFPRSLQLAAGDDPGKLQPFLDVAEVRFLESNLQFTPVKGRYLRITIGAEGAAVPWEVGELRVWGFDGAQTIDSAVIATTNRTEPVRKAAQDLAYYAAEITGAPVAVAPPEDRGKYKGLALVMDVPVPGEYPADDILRRGLQAVQVSKSGDEIHFSGETDTAIMYGVFEFLDRQGVRWLHPSPLGDRIARRGQLDLGCLPLRYEPPFVSRFYQGGVNHQLGSENIRWFAHSHWNKFFNYYGGITGDPPYRNNGHHSLQGLLPGEQYKEHPDWFPMLVDEKYGPLLKKQGYDLNQRLPYSASQGAAFCTANEEARDCVARLQVEHMKKYTNVHSIMVGQMDTSTWCQCPKCRAQDKTPGRMTERLVDLARGLDQRMKKLLPGQPVQIAVMAYNNSLDAPELEGGKLPDTITFDVVICSEEDRLGGPYRYFQAPDFSEGNRQRMELVKKWAKATNHQGIYTWDLLLTGACIPLPGVDNLAKWFKFWKEMGGENVMPEASGGYAAWNHSPWVHYAYGRLAWNPDEPAERIVNDFFNGYYVESAKPMLEYYRLLDDHASKTPGAYGATWQLQATPATFPEELVKKMKDKLDQAKDMAGDDLIRGRIADAEKAVRKVCTDLNYKTFSGK